MRKRRHQELFEFPKGRGGKRKGAGRKPKGKQAGVPHVKREEFVGDVPLHVTLKVRRGFRSLRCKQELRTVLGVLERYGEREGFRVTEYSVLGDHVHLVVEAATHVDLTRGVSALATSLAHRLNRLWARHGRVFADRFHSRLLRSPTEVRNALKYVLHNARNHGFWLWDDRPDPCSSGECFEGWEDYCARGVRWLAAAKSWLLRSGWRRAGPIRLAWE